MEPEKRVAFKTELLDRGKIVNEVLPPHMVFRPSRINKIATSVLAAGGGLGLIIFLMKDGIWGPSLFILVVAVVSLIKIWHIDADNTIKLDKKGLYYNEDLYSWKSIVSSHILYTQRLSRNEENDSYLILELANGKIKKLELTRINFSKFYLDGSSQDEVIFGHYIEMYKRHAV
jgi:hypothetical protein